MDCENYVDLMTEYLEGDLSPHDRDAWEKHFADCPPCKDFFASFRSSLELVTYLRARPAPQPVRDRLHRVISDRLTHEKPSGN
jgi:anti-sigma factor RsiW